MKLASEYLEDALALIQRPDGWCKNQEVRPRDPAPFDSIDGYAVCAEGAVFAACGAYDFGSAYGTRVYDTATGNRMHARRLIGRYLVPAAWGGRVAAYNDAPTTRKHHIVALFQKAIRRAKAAESESLDVPPQPQPEREPELVS